MVLADVDGDGVSRAAAETGAEGARLDVRDRQAVTALVDSVVADHGRLDIMVNNAGLSLGGETHHMPAPYWDRIMDVNIGGVVNGVLVAYPRMVAQGSGHIVNVASGAGLSGAVFTAAYSMTKHAVVGLSTTLRPEAAMHGVRVNVVCPGAVDTPILDSSPPADLPEPTGGLRLTGREYMAKVGLRPMPADVFARRALRHVARNRNVIVIPGSARALWALHRVSPAATQLIGRMTARRLLER